MASRGVIYLASEIAFSTTNKWQRDSGLRTPDGLSEDMRGQSWSWQGGMLSKQQRAASGNFVSQAFLLICCNTSSCRSAQIPHGRLL